MHTDRDKPSKNPGPLSGMKVVELAHIMAGPACGLLLADMGADVIKVEKTGSGDDSRRFLPPDIQGESAAYMMMNRNKRGIALDLKQTDGKPVIPGELTSKGECTRQKLMDESSLDPQWSIL